METVAERMARELGQKIVIGELAPGAPLRQDHVAALYKSSHVPAREALQLLRARGLVTHESRRGMRVAALDAKTISEVVEIRAALETLALRHAATRMTPQHFQLLNAAIAEGDAAQTLAEWDQSNRAFHQALVAPCRLPRLLSLLDDLQLVSSRILIASLRDTSWKAGSNQCHRRIVSALKQRDSKTAVALLEAHIRGLERSVEDVDAPAAP